MTKYNSQNLQKFERVQELTSIIKNSSERHAELVRPIESAGYQREKEIFEEAVNDLGLTEIADINRATFYVYYTDIMDMLDQIQNEAYELFEDVLVGTEDHIDSMETFAKYIENILIFCKENPTIARFVITREYNNNKVLKKIKKLLAKKVPVAKENYSQDDPRRFVLNFALNALTGTVVDWMDDGMIIPPAVMAEFIANMYISGSLHAKQKFQSFDKADDE